MPSPADGVAELTDQELQRWPLPALTGNSKNSRGDVWVIGGARRTPGAVMLAGQAALRAGAGRLTLAVAESVAVPVAVAVPESGVVGLPESAGGSIMREAADVLASELDGCDALLVGPGLDDPDETAFLLDNLARRTPDDTVVVLDAYALGILDRARGASEAWADRLVLTPNAEELERLVDLDPGTVQDDDALRRAVAEAAKAFSAVITCQNVIADAGGALWRTDRGSIGLGTSGSGDVLAGALTGMLARGAEPAQAACWATHLHIRVGQRLADRFGRVGFLARDMLDELPRELDRLSRP